MGCCSADPRDIFATSTTVGTFDQRVDLELHGLDLDPAVCFAKSTDSFAGVGSDEQCSGDKNSHF